jgi:hypothetical protein
MNAWTAVRLGDRWEWALAGGVCFGALLPLVLLLLLVVRAPAASRAPSGDTSGLAPGAAMVCCWAGDPARVDRGVSGASQGVSLLCSGDGGNATIAAGSAWRAPFCRSSAELPAASVDPRDGRAPTLWLTSAVVCAWLASLRLIGNPLQGLRPARRQGR